MEWLQQVLDGSPDAATVEHLRRGLTTWLRSAAKGRRGADGKVQRARSLSLARCLSLPENPERVRIMQRDGYLRAAALLLPVDPARTWTVAAKLCTEVQRFRGHRWPCWVGLSAPPPNASDLDRLLFLAMGAGGGKLPTTARQLATILQS